MVYQRLGRTGIEISRLSFGAMRLPTLENGDPDPDESIRVIHRAFELGVNYIDTAVMYCRHQSQSVVGEAVRTWNGHRVYISTKNHYRGADEKVWWGNLEDSLQLLGVDCIDLYNIHGVNWDHWEKWMKGPNAVMSWMHKAHDQGLIGHVCCSFHDEPEALSKIAATDEFSAITLQYNMLYRDLEPVFPEIAERDIGIVVMGPIGGGQLQAHSDSLDGMLEGAASPAELALRFVLANPNVTAAISGMSTTEMVEENCAIGGREEPLCEAEREQVVATLDRLKGLSDLYCTGCNYCMPCPSGVDIPQNFKAVNLARVYGLKEQAQQQYGRIVGNATYCQACGLCEPKCPQNIPIHVQLREAAARFGVRQGDRYGEMAVSFNPVRRDDDGIECLAWFRNVSDTDNKAVVRFEADSSTRFDPETLEIDIQEAFKRRDVSFTISPEAPVQGEIRFQAVVQDAKGERPAPGRFVVADCPRVEAMQDLVDRSEGQAPLAVRSEAQAYVGADVFNDPFAFAAWVGYTADSLLVLAKLDYKGEADAASDERHGLLDVVVDLRNPENFRAPGYQDGVYLLRVATDAPQPANVLRGELEAKRVAVECVPTDTGAELRVAIPWDALGGYDPEPGEAIGLDLLFVCQEKGRDLFRAGWAGDPDVHRTGATGTLFLGDGSNG